MRRRQPRPLAGALERVVGELAPPTTLAAVQRAWPEVAGEALARAATPVAERDGTVTLRCREAVWAQELDLLSPVLVERLCEALGEPSVTRLRVVVGGTGDGDAA